MRVLHPFRYPELGRVDAGFLDPRYPVWRRQAGLSPDEHPGVDFNLQGTSGDQDLGHPVLCLAPGVVEEVAHDDVWGHVVLVRHDQAVARYVGRILGREIPALWSQYAHLFWPVVERGQRVLGGQAIGSIGKGGGQRYWAHLHFELRVQDLPALHWPGRRRDVILQAYLDPAPVLQKCVQEHRYVWPALIVNLAKPDVPQVRPAQESDW